MKPISLSLCLLLALTTPVTAAAQSTADWSRVQALAASAELLVETKEKKKLKGNFVSATEASLVIERAAARTEIARDRIQRVYRLTGKTRGRSALKGAAIGGAIGLAAGLIFYLPARDDNEVLAVPAFTLIGGGIGAGLGALMGKGRRRELIYSP
jgi:hypothetical protein